MILHPRSPAVVLSILCALTLAGCVGDDSKETASDGATSTTTGMSGTTSGTGGTTGETSDGGSAGGSATDSTSTTATSHASHTTDTTDTTASTGDPTGGGDIPASCAAACSTLIGCFPEEFESEAMCVELCTDESSPPEPDPACEAAAVAFNLCLAGASCAELEDDQLFPCGAELEAMDAACGGGGGEECIGGAGVDPDTMSCSLSETCPDYDRMITCTVKECTCFEDGQQTAVCPVKIDVDPCSDFAIVAGLAPECCGWQI